MSDKIAIFNTLFNIINYRAKNKCMVTNHLD
nr:hypothetical protein KE13KAR1_00012 [African swine fever virus]CAK8179498.1 hypothetical protein KE13BUS3WSL_00011 [African swine fever virus]CAK8179659.1 hypothetical protein KE13BUS3WLD_KE13BUS3WLD_00012 [African swine fever virus]CAK8180006.1 hypothetical protein KE12BUS5_00011 [African swine fever virus]CAK8180164.1 hypothetical protein KE13SIA4_00011 [African swine fever virus]